MTALGGLVLSWWLASQRLRVLVPAEPARWVEVEPRRSPLAHWRHVR